MDEQKLLCLLEGFAAHTFLIALMESSASCQISKMTLQSFSSEGAFWDVFSNLLHVALNENLRRHLFIFNLKNNTFQQKSVPQTSAPLAGGFAGGLLLNIGLPGSVFYFIFPPAEVLQDHL